MSTSKNAKTQDLPAKCFVFVRFWIGWNSDSDFPFEKFNWLADDKIGDALEAYAKQWLSENPAKVKEKVKERAAKRKELIRQRRRGFAERPNRPDSEDIQCYKECLQSFSGDRLVEEAELLEVPIQRNRKQFIKAIHLAGVEAVRAREFEFSRLPFSPLIIKGLRPVLFFSKQKEQTRAQAPPLIVTVARLVGWVTSPMLQYGSSLTSHRYPVFCAKDQCEADQVADVLQKRIHGDCPQFGVLGAAEFSPADCLAMERGIDDLVAGESTPSVMEVAVEALQTIAREAAKIAKILPTPDHQCAGVDADETDTRDADQCVKQKRGRKRKYDEVADRDIIAKWHSHKLHGGTRKEFERERGIKVCDLEAAQDRLRRAKNRRNN